MTELENAIDEAVRIYVKAVHAEDPNFSFDDLPEVHKFQLRSLVMSMVWPVMKAARAQGWDEGYETCGENAYQAARNGRSDWRAPANPYRS